MNLNNLNYGSTIMLGAVTFIIGLMFSHLFMPAMISGGTNDQRTMYVVFYSILYLSSIIAVGFYRIILYLREIKEKI